MIHFHWTQTGRFDFERYKEGKSERGGMLDRTKGPRQTQWGQNTTVSLVF